MSDVDVDVAIVGAGFAGLACAAVCADAGMSVAVLERRPALAPEGVGLVLQPNGLAVLDRLGLIPDVLAAGQRIDTARQCDDRGRTRAQAHYTELQHPHPYLVVVERTAVIDILAARVPPSVSMRFGCSFAGLERTGARVTGLRYTDGSGVEQTLQARCVVGADGINSAVRASMGARSTWVTGPDRFLIGIAPVAPAVRDAVVLYCGNGWCDGVLPLGERTYFFDHVTAENREAIEGGDFDAWRSIYAGRIPEGEQIASSLGSFDDVGFLSGRTHRAVPRTGPGVALVGDAAGAVHPHNGQGANLALEDALTLATAFAIDGPGSEVALRRFARERDAKLRRYVPWSIFIGRTFDGPHLGWRAMRRFGYVGSRIPALRRSTSRRQAGLG